MPKHLSCPGLALGGPARAVRFWGQARHPHRRMEEPRLPQPQCATAKINVSEASETGATFSRSAKLKPSGRRDDPQPIVGCDGCARKARFHARNQFDRLVAIIRRIRSSLHFPIFRTIIRSSPLGTEGRFAVVTRREAGRRWTRTWLLTRATEADGEIVWSWRPKGWR